MMHYGYGMGGGMFWWHWGLQLLILALFFLVIWWLLKGGGEDPLRTLKRRLANGEISEKEYRKLKKEIE